MALSIQVPDTSDEEGRLAELELVDVKRSFMIKTLKERGLQGWQPATTAALLAAWDLVESHVFFDVGANVGIYALLHNRRWPDGTTIAFEPTPELVRIGKSIAKANGLEVQWEQLAVSDAEGTAPFYLSARSDASSSLAKGFRRAKGVLTVPTTTLDSYVARSALTPSVVKIDVEDHEPAVLRGADSLLRRTRPIIVAELIPGRHASVEVRRILDDYGYHARHLVPLSDDEYDPSVLRDWLFWPDEIPAAFDTRFAEWSAVVARCTPQGSERKSVIDVAQTEADRYYGDAVANYEASRRKQRTWRREHSAFKKILSGMPKGLRVLDVPVGTGRFFALYKRRHLDVVGVDISEEMVGASRKHADEVGLDVTLETGSILDLPYKDDEFDLSVSVRMMQWLSPEDTHTAIGELARVTNGTVIITAHHRLFPWPTPTAIRTRRDEQYKRRRKRRHGKQVMTLHRRKDLMRSFATHGLHVERRVEVVDKPGMYSYSMWVLRTS